jgi:hypothetical protein
MAAIMHVRQAFALTIFLLYIFLALISLYEIKALWALVLLVPLHLVYWPNIRQRRHTILRNYPLLGYLRYFFESLRPELRRYFFESDLDGRPFNRRQRSGKLPAVMMAQGCGSIRLASGIRDLG